MARDVTERHQAEEARAAFGRILEESLNEIYVFDAATLRFLQANRGARENLGYSMQELRERTPLDLAPELSSEDLAGLLEPLRSGRTARIGFETVQQRKDGSRYPVEAHLQQVTLDGAPVIVAFVVDLTERVRAAEELAETDRRACEAERLASIGLLAAGLAHDIGTPMNVILGYAEMLRDSLSEERDRERVRIISEQVRRVSDLVRILTNLARPHEATREPVALAKLLEDSLAFYREKLHARRIDVRRSFEVVPDVLADEGRLQQVFLNLLVNAADAMPTGGSLDVSLSRVGEKPCGGAHPGHGRRHPRGGAGSALRAVLHHQGRGSRDGPGPPRQQGHRRRSRRHDRRLQRSREGDGVPDRAPGGRRGLKAPGARAEPSADRASARLTLRHDARPSWPADARRGSAGPGWLARAVHWMAICPRARDPRRRR